MHTKRSPDNPYWYNHYGFAWEYVPQGSEAHLDFGCAEGELLGNLRAKQIPRLVGVEIRREAVEAARKKYPEIEFVHLAEGKPLPFPDKTFSSITFLDVIEHVDDQIGLLSELHRVLVDDGVLVLSTAGKCVFSFLDMGNFKFRFPTLHRWYYCWRHSREEYEYAYVSNPDGLVGDISAKKRWHEHFSRTGMSQLLEKTGFEVLEFDGAKLFERPIRMVGIFLEWMPPFKALFNKLYKYDSKWFESSLLFCTVRKQFPENV